MKNIFIGKQNKISLLILLKKILEYFGIWKKLNKLSFDQKMYRQ